MGYERGKHGPPAEAVDVEVAELRIGSIDSDRDERIALITIESKVNELIRSVTTALEELQSEVEAEIPPGEAGPQGEAGPAGPKGDPGDPAPIGVMFFLANNTRSDIGLTAAQEVPFVLANGTSSPIATVT